MNFDDIISRKRVQITSVFFKSTKITIRKIVLYAGASKKNSHVHIFHSYMKGKLYKNIVTKNTILELKRPRRGEFFRDLY